MVVACKNTSRPKCAFVEDQEDVLQDQEDALQDLEGEPQDRTSRMGREQVKVELAV